MMTGASARNASERLFGRFVVLDELGEGGFGRVLRCRDEETGGEVAVKLLRGMSPSALLALKREFRAVADVSHPALVQLGELFEQDGDWGFSMELVPGTDFGSWVRTSAQGRGFDEARLRSGLVQLVEALMALHGMGFVHRDVKPENVRVTRDGRVKLLDFGLVQALEGALDEETLAVGTAAYMAPEQARGDRVGEAADWYALGVLLYECLCGELPFDGTALSLLLRKQREHAVPPSARAEGVPPDLERVCLGLLEPDIALRWSGAQVLARLSPGASASPSLTPARVVEPFVGRKAELEALHRELARALAGELRLVLIEGESGIGKTSLVSQLVGEARERHKTVLGFFGRCHPVEHVPFKLFDHLVDGLSGHLRSLDPRDAAALLPSGAAALPRLFPVLSRVPALQKLRHASELSAPLERYELFARFAELLARVATDQPLVLAVDDLQWCDAASFALLDVLRERSRRARVLLVATVRPIDSVEGDVGTALRALVDKPHVTRLPLHTLADDEARELVLHLASREADPDTVGRLCRAAGGHPLFVSELARQLTFAASARESALDLDALLERRARAQDPPVRDALALLAVSGVPLPRSVLELCAKEPGEALTRAMLVLRRERLARFARSSALACYHDRLREAVLRTLDAKSERALHERLAQAWQRVAEPEPSAVARHLLAIGDAHGAAPWLERAARRAFEGAAFEQAAQLYERRLALDAPLAPDARHALLIAHADALASAGRYAQAAQALRDALPSSAHERERASLLGRVAQLLLQAGIVDEGNEAARAALEQVGLTWPGSTSSTVMRLLFHRVAMALGSRTPRVRVEADVPALARDQLDIMWRLTQPLAWADLFRGAELVSRHLRSARAAGSARHVELALRAEAPFVAMQRPLTSDADVLLARADRVAAEDAANDVVAYRALSRGQVALVRWELERAENELLIAERTYREHCPGEAWMLTNTRSMLMCAWFTRGRFARLAAAADAWLGDASQRGDRFALASYSLLGFGFVRHIMRNQVDAAAAEAEQSIAPWRGERVGLQHVGEALAQHAVNIARGGVAAAHYWQATAPLLERSFLIRTAFMRDSIDGDRTSAALCAAASTEDATERARWLREARTWQRKLARRSTHWAKATAPLYDAEIAVLEGRREHALAAALVAHAAFASMGHFVARLVEVLIGRIEGGASGRARAESVLAWLRDEGFEDPELWVRVWLPTAHAIAAGRALAG